MNPALKNMFSNRPIPREENLPKTYEGGGHATVAPMPKEVSKAFEEWRAGDGACLTRVPLLKAIEARTARLYEEEHLSKVEDAALRTSMRAVVLESNMAGLEEFGELWFKCIRAKMDRMTMCAEWVRNAMFSEASGFDAFERAFISGAAEVLPCYHAFYLDYLAAVQDKQVAAALKASPPPPSAADVFSSYTVVEIDGSGGFTTSPFAKYFDVALCHILHHFDDWIGRCAAAEATPLSGPWAAADRAAYVAFLRQYRHCLGLHGEPAALEAAWRELDIAWMKCRMPIQLIHDIETGYTPR